MLLVAASLSLSSLSPRETFSLNPFLCWCRGAVVLWLLLLSTPHICWCSPQTTDQSRHNTFLQSRNKDYFQQQQVIKWKAEVAGLTFWLSENVSRPELWLSAAGDVSTQIPPCSSASDWPPGSERLSDWLRAPGPPSPLAARPRDLHHGSGCWRVVLWGCWGWGRLGK